ncbi:unnamed protein product [Protopolystoma xenopodis]|uniref:MIP18 family-like domain-containing protein n=1 Tax=Protopolystoma xenopodis TaxID=117903 RepID=A0A448WF05_9PLAT|nr:unnamed protein product [Protopolystoma xenopodis]
MLENINPVLHPIGPRFISRVRDPVTSFYASNQHDSSSTDHRRPPREPIERCEIFEHIRDIRDPEHPHTLEALGVVTSGGEDDDCISVDDAGGRVSVYFRPTIPGCSMAALIGLALKVKLIRSLPRRFKVGVTKVAFLTKHFCVFQPIILEKLGLIAFMQTLYPHPSLPPYMIRFHYHSIPIFSDIRNIKVAIAPGAHDKEDEVNKQLADKERVAAALENPALLRMINECLANSSGTSDEAGSDN